MNKICPVCGYDKLSDFPYDEYGYPTYTICSCCGYEFGFDDSSKKLTFEVYRDAWIKKGYKYFNKEKQPDTWNKELAEKQLKNIEKTNYKPRIH